MYKLGELLSKAIMIASIAFEGEVDKGGQPYILHCLWVMNKVRHLGHKAMIVAVLHDLLEDCKEWTAERLREAGFPEDIIDALKLLNHDKKNVPYDTYVKNLSFNELAKAVKLRDLEHNSKITRLKGLGKSDLERMEKYHRAYVYLKN
jgi:guanosine-3',5'-bis(diphosphate) 3'-pyrophosphohydrolase